MLAPLLGVFGEILLLMVFKHLDRVIYRIAWHGKTKTAVTMDTFHERWRRLQNKCRFSRLTEESARRTRGARVTRREKFKRTSRSFPPSPPCVCFHSPGKTQLNHGFFVVVIVVERSFTLNERNHRCKKKKKREKRKELFCNKCFHKTS